MYMKLIIEGKNADKSSFIFAKKPANHFVTNERIISDNDYTRGLSDGKFEFTSLDGLELSNETLSALRKDKILDKENNIINKKSHDCQYFIEEGKLIRKKNKDIEGHAIYLDYSPERVEFLIFGKVDSLVYSKEYDGYVNEKEYEVSSIFQSLITDILKTALDKDSEFSGNKYDITCVIGPFSRTLKDETLKLLFEPLNYNVEIDSLNEPLKFKNARKETFVLTLKKNDTIKNVLNQIYVLISAIDSYKHFKIQESDVQKFKRYTNDWLETHPLNKLITQRYLRYTNFGNEIISEFNKKKENKDLEDKIAREEEFYGENGQKLNTTRLNKMKEAILKTNPKTVLDFGCGEGNLLKEFINEKDIEIVGIDSSMKALDDCYYNFLRLSKANKDKEIKIPEVKQGSLYYIDSSLKGKFDTIVLCEVIEHLELERLSDVLDNIMYLDPKNLIISTPNRAFNKFFKNRKGEFRYYDHRFEFTDSEFEEFCNEISSKYNLKHEISGFGREIEGIRPTLICSFSK